MSDGYQVDPEAMERITRGINQADAFFDPDTDWQWSGPPSSASDGEGEG